MKEYYYFLDSTPTHSFMRFLYKYPQAEFPYRRLIDENRVRFGQTKGQKAAKKLDTERARRELEGKKRED